MPKTIVPFNSDNEDIMDSHVYWYDRDGVFIEQVETKTPGNEKIHKELLLFGRDGVPTLIAALQQFLAQ